MRFVIKISERDQELDLVTASVSDGSCPQHRRHAHDALLALLHDLLPVIASSLESDGQCELKLEGKAPSNKDERTCHTCKHRCMDMEMEPYCASPKVLEKHRWGL